LTSCATISAGWRKQAFEDGDEIAGAPKVRAMEIIRELESEPRGVYTGAVGMLAPGGEARLNVAIRTLVLDADGRGEIGIGSGVVNDSQAEAEYDECILKMRFLTEPAHGFELIETLLYEAGRGYALLERHLDRLAASAAYFGYRLDRETARRALEAEARGCREGALRVRLLLAGDGALSLSSTPLAASEAEQTLRYIISDRPADSGDVFLYHKTTNRDLYEAEHARAAELGADEVLFVNERGELTEGTRTNLFIRRGGTLLTPPVESGLLPGTLRADLLARGEARETVLTPDDLEGAEAVYLGNSVRGLVPAAALYMPASGAAEG
jgi:para-aminobenzoate synthetase/4-amino-4-deoxychorismate lyase